MCCTSWFLAILSLRVVSSSANIFSHPTGRIVGGSDTETSRYPYFVLLSGREGVCGGSLIAPDMVLTAAHCPSVTFARFGDENNDTNGTLGFSDLFKIRAELAHPQYEPLTKKFDQKILLLNRPSQRPVVSIGYDFSDDDLANVDLKIIGVGQDADGMYADQLQDAELEFIPREECENIGDQTFSFENLVFEDMFCGLGNEVGACFGDSGGPLIVESNDTESDFLVGLVSWGLQPCAQWPSVFSSVSVSYPWIQEVVCSLSSDAPTSFQCPTPAPSASSGPSSTPSRSPSFSPSLSKLPSSSPSTSPPSFSPSSEPSSFPSTFPSSEPSVIPSDSPTNSLLPSLLPSLSPSAFPSEEPSIQPSPERVFNAAEDFLVSDATSSAARSFRRGALFPGTLCFGLTVSLLLASMLLHKS